MTSPETQRVAAFCAYKAAAYAFRRSISLDDILSSASEEFAEATENS